MAEDLTNHQLPPVPNRDAAETQLNPQRSEDSLPPFSIDTSIDSKKWAEAVHAKQARMLIADKNERSTLICELAELYSQKLVYRQASPNMAGSGTELKAMPRLAELAPWKPRLDCLSHLFGQIKDGVQRGNFYYTAGVIYRDEVNSPDQAVTQFNLALDSYFAEPKLIPGSEVNTYLKPFEAIKEIYIQPNDWKKLEANHRKMLGRMQRAKVDQTDIMTALWYALGEIYRLHDKNAAIQTFEVLDAMQAIDVPADLELFLRPPPNGEQGQLGRRPQKGPIQASEPSLFSNVFSYVLEALVPGRKPKERPAPASGLSRFGKMFTYVKQVLNEPANLEFYFCPDQADDLRFGNCKERGKYTPSVLIGGRMLEGRSDQELVFPISVFLAKLRREHYLRLVISAHSELSVAIHAAIYLVEPRFLQNSIVLNVAQQYSESMRPGLSLVESEYLKAVVPRFTQAKSKLDMEKWTQAVDLTAHRGGLLIANDLTLAARFIGSEPESVGGLETKDKLAEHLRYAVSPQYFEVRQQLGIAL